MRKSLSILMFVVGASFLFFNCQKDEEQESFWYSYGSYYESNESDLGFKIYLDDGTTLIPTEASGISSNVKDSSRVVAVYAKVSESDETIKAKITSIVPILTIDVLQLTEETQDSIGNDGTILNDNGMWFSENHLNIVYNYYGYSGLHFFNVVKPIGNQKDENDRQILEFKHNANDDHPNALYSDVVSINMWSLYEEGLDSLPFVLKWTDYQNTEHSWEGTFYFNQPVSEGKSYTGEPDLYKNILR